MSNRMIKDALPVDVDGPFEDELSGSGYYMVEAYFENKAQAQRWVTAQLRRLGKEEDALEPKRGLWAWALGR